MSGIRFAVAGGTLAGPSVAFGSHKDLAEDPYAITFRNKHRARFEALAASVRQAQHHGPQPPPPNLPPQAGTQREIASGGGMAGPGPTTRANESQIRGVADCRGHARIGCLLTQRTHAQQSRAALLSGDQRSAQDQRTEDYFRATGTRGQQLRRLFWGWRTQRHHERLAQQGRQRPTRGLDRQVVAKGRPSGLLHYRLKRRRIGGRPTGG
jgi:hypothetical protein